MSEIEPREIGRRIKAARKRKQWTQLQLAIEAERSPSSVSRWERGQLPAVRELIRLAGVLEVDPGVFVTAQPTQQDEISALRAEIAEMHALLDRVAARQEDAENDV